MEINKRCISAFSRVDPFVALGTKSKLFDPTFSLTSDLVLINYISGKIYPAIATELKFCKILWCEFRDCKYLAAGHENGVISVYERTDDGLVLLKTKKCLDDDVTALDFLASKAVLVAGSSKGKIIFWTLSKMENEYALDIPVSIGISSLAWNPKVSKILCVGSPDGVIKVLDIKKNSIIMTLNNKEFSEVRHLEWDPDNNTKLNVISEKGYVTVFDLSSDMTTKLGDHKDPIIGFHRGIIVSKTQIEVGGSFTAIKDSFECAISPRDPVLALSYVNGSTGIVSVPVMRKTRPFCRVSRQIYTPTAKFEIEVTNNAKAPATDPIYGSMLEMIHSGSNLEDVAEFLLEKSSEVASSLVDPKANIKVDMKDQHSVEYVHGSIANLKTDPMSLRLGTLDCLFSRDASSLAEITDFKPVYVLSRLLNDYSALGNVSNPRVLAAILIFNKVGNFDLLKGSAEGRILNAILTGDYGLYIDRCIPATMPYLKRMKMLESLVESVKDFTKNNPLRSAKISEYFWYKVFLEGPQAVDNMNIIDPDIQFYLEMQKQQTLNSKIKNLSVKGQFAHVEDMPRQSGYATPSSLRTAGQMPTGYSPTSSGYSTASAPIPYRQTPTASRPGIPTSPQTAYSVVPPQQQHGFPTQPQQQRQPSPAASAANWAPVPPKAQSAPRMAEVRQTAPEYGQSSGVVYPVPVQPAFNIPQKPQAMPQRPYGVPTDPYSPSSTMPQPPQASGGFKTPVSMLGGLPQRPSMTQMAANPAIPSPVAPPQAMQARTAEVPPVENADAIISAFDRLVTEIREKADANKSLILRQRKMQYLNALVPYGSLDKFRLPPSILHVMDHVSKRVISGGANLKSDLDVLVQGFNDVVWLRAAVELIKMVY